MNIIIGAAIVLFFFASSGWSLYGAALGLSIVLMLNLLIGSLKMSFRFTPFGLNRDKLIGEAFPLFAARLARAADSVEKTTVLNMKDTSIRLFGLARAAEVMKVFKGYVEEGVPEQLLEKKCRHMRNTLPYKERVDLITVLSSIIRKKEQPNRAEYEELSSLAARLGIRLQQQQQYNHSYQRTHYNQGQRFHFHFGSSAEFQDFFNNFNQSNHSPYSSRSSINSHFETLELSPEASNNEIKQQYRTLSKKYHPDRAASLPEEQRSQHEKRMREINNAYEQLKKYKNIK